MRLRFLNSEGSVDCTLYVHQAESFKKALEALHHASDMRSIALVTQEYFKEEFSLPVHAVNLVIRYDKHVELLSSETMVAFEKFFGSVDQQKVKNVELVRAQGILVKDELAFTNFYEESTHLQHMLMLMDELKLEVFIPIIDHGILIACIMIEANARPNNFFVRNEQDQMRVFASCVGGSIMLLRNKCLQSVVYQYKSLQDEVYEKHQQINQYKESLRFFLHDTAQRKIGLVLYKNRQFSLLNPQAKELISINLNHDAGHPLSIAMKAMIQRLESYASAQTSMVNMPKSAKLVVNANFYAHKTSIIFTISRPEVADLIQPYVSALADPSEWDYLLYLQTTASGRLINQLLPGSTPTLMHTKLELLKMALSSKALLIDALENDMLSVVEIVHHISLKKELIVLDLKEYPHAQQQGAVLFGGLGFESVLVGLLEEPAHPTTLFIKNIHLLALNHQETLAHYIQYGCYANALSPTTTMSHVRILCASTLHLDTLLDQQKFSATLLKQLQVSVLKIPCLSSLAQEDLVSLIEGYSAQAIPSVGSLNLVGLSNYEQNKLIAHSPPSITAFKERVKTILRNKTDENSMTDQKVFDPSYEFTDPLLAQAVRLGKTSLKDKSIMQHLWNKFNNQKKIASLLGVNRSSVNRRCKEFGLE